MQFSIILVVCILLLLAYVFDITSAKTKIPTVVLLLLLGYLVKQISIFLELNIVDLNPILPILGTIGLILIVLEGSLELEFNRSKLPIIGITTALAFFPLVVFSFVLGYIFYYFGNGSFKDSLVNAIPFAVISSAIAIPSAQNLIAKNKEFLTYESSLSDIFGVILFNFIALNSVINLDASLDFVGEIAITLLITITATLILSFLLSKIKHHVKFAPIMITIMLIYEISKFYHLPALVFILIFGLVMGNLDEIKNKWFVRVVHPEVLQKEVHKFKELVAEITFLIRSLFFLVFGFLIDISELLNQDTILWSLGVIALIFFLRFLFLLIFKIPVFPLLFIAPRGLITILLFLSIPINQKIDLVNNSFLIQVIILTAFIMMIGMIFYKKDKPPKEELGEAQVEIN